MPLPIAVDNSVLGDLTDPYLPPNKLSDRKAFEKMIELDRQDIIEIGVPITSTMIEEQGAGEKKRRELRNKMGKAYRLWPVAVPQHLVDEIEKRKQCLKSIMQDKDGIDSDNLIIATLHSAYYITTDYRYYRQFNTQLEKIKKKCNINVSVLTPTDFIAKFEAKEL